MARDMVVRISEGVKRQFAQERYLEAEYDRAYSLTSLILFFFSASTVGWLWEVFLHIFMDGALINRGTTWGPWLPIYGVGGVMTLVLLRKFADKPAHVFAFAYLGSGILEYTTGWALEQFRGVKYWDYSESLFNINGRVCLEVLALFAVGACFILYIAAPAMDNLYRKIPQTAKVVLCVVLITLFAADLVFSALYPKMGPGITMDVSETTKWIF